MVALATRLKALADVALWSLAALVAIPLRMPGRWLRPGQRRPDLRRSGAPRVRDASY